MDTADRLRVLVTGAGGFVGRALAASLAADGYDVFALDRRPRDPIFSGPHHSIAIGAEIISGAHHIFADLADRAAVARAVDDSAPDIVFHAGAVVDLARDHAVARACIAANIAGTQHLLEALAARPPRALVYVSTTDVYGDGPMPADEEQRERPVSPYGVTKLAGEQLCRVYHRAFGVPSVIARVATVYGPGQRPERMIPAVILAALAGRAAALAGDGSQRRDLVYLDDAVAGLCACIDNSAALGQTINLGHEEPVAWRDVVERARRLAGPEAPPPGWNARPERPGEPRLWASQGARARELLDWRPTTSLDDGLARTVAYYRAQLAAVAPPVTHNPTTLHGAPHGRG